MTANRASLLAGQAELNDRMEGLLDRKRALSLDVASGVEAATSELTQVLRDIDQATRDRGIVASALEGLDQRRDCDIRQQRLARIERELAEAQKAIAAVRPAYRAALEAGLALRDALAALTSAVNLARSAEGGIAADPRALSYQAAINVEPSINGMLESMLRDTAFEPVRVDAVTEALRQPDGAEIVCHQVENQIASALNKVDGGTARARREIEG